MNRGVFLVLSILGLFSGLVFADTDGVWHYAKDVRGGIFGSDEATTSFGFSSQVNFSGGVKVGSGSCVLLETDAGGVISCNTTPLTLQGISDRGNTTNKQLSVPSIADYNDATFGLDPSSSSFLKTLYSDTIRVNTIKSCSGKIATDAQGGLYCGVDAVNDADANPANEIQTLSIAGSTLTISSGNSVVLPTVSEVDPKIAISNVNHFPKWNGSKLIASAVFDNGNVVMVGPTGMVRDFSVPFGNSYFGGNLGVGISNPVNKFEVSGNSKFTGNVNVGGKICDIVGGNCKSVSSNKLCRCDTPNSYSWGLGNKVCYQEVYYYVGFGDDGNNADNGIAYPAPACDSGDVDGGLVFERYSDWWAGSYSSGFGGCLGSQDNSGRWNALYTAVVNAGGPSGNWKNKYFDLNWNSGGSDWRHDQNGCNSIQVRKCTHTSTYSLDCVDLI